jgi:hypothetical protein
VVATAIAQNFVVAFWRNVRPSCSASKGVSLVMFRSISFLAYLHGFDGVDPRISEWKTIYYYYFIVDSIIVYVYLTTMNEMQMYYRTGPVHLLPLWAISSGVPNRG